MNLIDLHNNIVDEDGLIEFSEDEKSNLLQLIEELGEDPILLGYAKNTIVKKKKDGSEIVQCFISDIVTKDMNPLIFKGENVATPTRVSKASISIPHTDKCNDFLVIFSPTISKHKGRIVQEENNKIIKEFAAIRTYSLSDYVNDFEDLRDRGFNVDSFFNKSIHSAEYYSLSFVKYMNELRNKEIIKKNEAAKIDAAKKQIAVIEKESEEKLIALKRDIHKKEVLLENIENRLKKHEETLDILDKYGIISKEENTKEVSEYKNPEITLDNLANQVTDFLASEKGLYYNSHLIKSFLIGISTEQLIILYGKPGTGKTSLVSGMASALNGKSNIIPVKPNWVDDEDLLGYYNPMDRMYVPTAFLDAIAEANENPNQIYLICLDEMNLSHVEYYFADFLSVLQSENKTLNLYSNSVYENELKSTILLLEELERNCQEVGTTTENFQQKLELERRLNTLKRYPARFKIPPNIRFLGTLNFDDTTKSLSPKVIDRSYVIEINDLKNDREKKEEPIKPVALSIDYFHGDPEVTSHFKEDWIYKHLNLHMSRRTVKYIMKAFSFAFDKHENYNESDNAKKQEYTSSISDALLSAIILPKINKIDDSDNDFNIVSDENIEVFAKYPLTNAILSDMKEYYNKEEIITYWR